MNAELRELIEEYQRKRWFPDKYPDPLGQLIDHLSRESVTNLVEEWKNTGSRAALSTAWYLMRLLPPLVFPELDSELRKAAANPLDAGILSQSAFYYVRSFPRERSIELWSKLREWTERWESVLFDWLTAEIHLEHSFPDIIQNLTNPESATLETDLAGSREFFIWKLQRFAKGAGLREVLQAFRFRHRESLADWNDFKAFAEAVVENSNLKKVQTLQRSETDPSAQFLFPIAPPDRVVQEYGQAAGPVDTLRFLLEFGRGLFYAGIDPSLPAENRISGDPSVGYFWGAVYAQLLTDRTSLTRFITAAPDDLADELQLVLEFWYRSDSFLTIYREKASQSPHEMKSAYAAGFESALTFAAPDFLYLYELLRSAESSFRTHAMRCAVIAVDRFRDLYGRQWFSNPRYSARVREYWWNGFRLTPADILIDLGVRQHHGYPFTPR